MAMTGFIRNLYQNIFKIKLGKVGNLIPLPNKEKQKEAKIMNLKGRKNESTAWQDVLAYAFASATIQDGFYGHTKKVLLSSVGNSLVIIDKETIS